ncbi:MAG TPA: c-type cytochrome biogenesis protein CcmF, partial [Methylococcaceae bacterium]|nr:c-type cytochrome biogenesis protein CcmF [Methylococcaceae bacterium]
MTAEIGQYCLLLALLTALFQGTLPLIGAARGQGLWMASAIPAGRAQFLFLALSFCALINGFIENDFSIFYVASHSNSALPLYYRIAATWGAHEGSMLLWAFILSGWTLAVTLFSGGLPPVFRARVLGIMGLISFGILLFIQWTSNPFLRLIPMPAEGNDLNPLLQDFGMTIHPPML